MNIGVGIVAVHVCAASARGIKSIKVTIGARHAAFINSSVTIVIDDTITCLCGTRVNIGIGVKTVYRCSASGLSIIGISINIAT